MQSLFALKTPKQHLWLHNCIGKDICTWSLVCSVSSNHSYYRSLCFCFHWVLFLHYFVTCMSETLGPPNEGPFAVVRTKNVSVCVWVGRLLADVSIRVREETVHEQQISVEKTPVCFHCALIESSSCAQTNDATEGDVTAQEVQLRYSECKGAKGQTIEQQHQQDTTKQVAHQQMKNNITQTLMHEWEEKSQERRRPSAKEHCNNNNNNSKTEEDIKCSLRRWKEERMLRRRQYANCAISFIRETITTRVAKWTLSSTLPYLYRTIAQNDFAGLLYSTDANILSDTPVDKHFTL